MFMPKDAFDDSDDGEDFRRPSGGAAGAAGGRPSTAAGHGSGRGQPAPPVGPPPSSGGYSRHLGTAGSAGVASAHTDAAGWPSSSHYSERPATTATQRDVIQDADDDEFGARPSTAAYGSAGPLPSENRARMLAQRREMEKAKRQRRMVGGIAMSSRASDGGMVPGQVASGLRTSAVPQFSAPRSFDPDGGDAARLSDDVPPMRAPVAGSGRALASAGASGPDDSYLQLVSPSSATASSGGMRDAERVLAERGLRAEFDPTDGASSVASRSAAAEPFAAARGASPAAAPARAVAAPRLDMRDLRKFALTPIPFGHPVVQCTIQRSKSGLRKMYPEYHLFIKEGAHGTRYLMSAKKRPRNRTSNYIISMNRADFERSSPNCVGKLRANFVGTEFMIYDAGSNPKDVTADQVAVNPQLVRQELGLVNYASNVLGSRGPRKMKVCIPHVDREARRDIWRPMSKEDDMMTKFKEKDMSHMSMLINKPPKWNETVGAYVLNFNGRVTMASVKNFQLVSPDDHETVVLQFGRVAKEEFTMDFLFPLCPMQAFAICLSSFDYKLACE